MPKIEAGQALRSLRVLDLSRVRAGPTCVRVLADFGADVIRVEPPMGLDKNADMFVDSHLAGDFQNLNRNKRSLTLNLKRPEGLAVFLRLVKDADVVVENWRPDVKKRLGVDYESLRAVNPRVILASISGFGQDGPYMARPGFDQIIQGMGGLMSVTGLPGQGPVRAGIAVADSSTGLYAALGILVALHEREQSGQGQWVQASLLHSQIAMMDFQMARHLNDGAVPVQEGNDHPLASPMGLFATEDGYLNIGVSGTGNWLRFCEAMGRPDWIEDPRFLELDDRIQNRTVLAEEITTLTVTHPTSHWVDLLNDAGVPAGPIYTVPQVFEDEQVKHLEVTTTAVTDRGRELTYITQPIGLNRTPASVQAVAPAPGEHTDEVLAEAGFSTEEISDLRSQSVI
ncbi:CaiB/BaiF CoA transferase family protein [Rhodococcus opacus]|uniref:CaiB/BaiF CoA transferase family protein n=1 Tax=Rhodococcus opacus TaxID=37919 RepID=UPI001C46F4AE|nr:CaiB/BaiF CoA-transferase family protein [Rhodococcus opacus]MBV6756708.1 CoA transferase [Rhodococcus opacus]